LIRREASKPETLRKGLLVSEIAKENIEEEQHYATLARKKFTLAVGSPRGD